MDLELRNSVAVVTGGASGIGKAIVEGFLAEDVRVVIWDAAPSTPDIAAGYENCGGIQVDIADEQSVAQALTDTLQNFETIDHLVHAAAVGSGHFGFPFTRVAPSHWSRVLDVNIRGTVHVAHAVAPVMTARRQGTITLVASVAGQIGSPSDPPYSASKAANINFAQVMARDLAPHNVRVNTVCPGMVRTPLNRSVWQSWHDQQPADERLSYDEWADRKIQQLVPLGRWQQPEHIADMIVFLASRRASEVTGQTINVDGGYVMHW